MFGPSFDPPALDTAAGEYERVRPVSINHGQLNFDVAQRDVYRPLRCTAAKAAL
jgi:hypothetical protein